MELAGRVRALDGVRGLALLAVLAYHAAPDVVGGGFLGVEMFFVLSGFLLATLLLDEEKRRGLIDPFRYAIRRLRRIAPALVVLLTVLVVAVPFVVPDDAHRIARDAMYSLGGLANWHLVVEGTSYFDSTGRPSLVRHLWSIAVEVQAYVLIPFVAAFLARSSRRRGVLGLVFGIALSATVMGLLYESPDPSRAYFGTDARIGAVLSGALVAVLVRRPGGTRRLTARASMLLAVAGLAGTCALVAFADERARVLYPAGFLATQLVTAALIVAVLSPGRPADLFANPALLWLGTRSYGIYLWHWPLVALVRPGIDVDWPRWATSAGAIAVATVLGALSYRVVERPFLERTTWARWPLPRATQAASAAWVGSMLVVVALVARSSTIDPIEQSLLAGEEALAEQLPPASARAPVVEEDIAPATRPQVVANARPRPVAEPASVPGRVPKAAGPPPGSVKISAVGDSVMLGAAKHLKARFGSKSYINAETNRRWAQAPKVVGDWRKAGRLGRVLVAHLGNNGPAKPEEIEATLKEAKPAEHVLLVTVRVNKPWQGETNDALRKVAEKHDTVWLVDWHAVSSGHRDWFYSDGTHVNPTGAEAYTKLIAAKIPPERKATPSPKPSPEATPPPASEEPTPTPGVVGGVIDPD